jgi:hypothetical protein
MEATVLLADWADVINGKLYIQGGAWTATPSPVNCAVAIVFAVNWNEANQQHHVAIRLLTEGGAAVVVDNQPVALESKFEVGRPPGVKPGSDLSVPLAWRLGGLPLNVGRYRFVVEVAGQPLAGRTFDVA